MVDVVVKAGLVEMKRFEKGDFNEFVLCGDVSGTNTTLAVAGVRHDGVVPLLLMRRDTADLSDLCAPINELLKQVFEKYGIGVSKCCLAAAGPVTSEGFCKLTNSPLSVDAKVLLQKTALNSVAVINDFESVGFGIQFLDTNSPSDMLTIPRNAPCSPELGGVKLIVGAGTGLGKSIVLFDSGRGMYFPIASEGGHQDLGALDGFELELMNFIRNKRGGGYPVDLESVLSGRGIAYIYDFLLLKNIFKRNAMSHDIYSPLNNDPAAVISKYADKDRACQTALEVFAKFYVRALRNSALECLAFGGVYIAGGIASKNARFFLNQEFGREFENNYAQNQLLKKMPIYLITNYNVNLYGAACVAAFFPERAVKK